MMTNTQSNAEFVIIGGGIYGTSLAHDLAKAGKTVILLEAGDIAGGASGGPGERGVRASGRDIRELPVASVSLERWRQFQETIEGGVGYRRIGGLTVIDKPYGQREHEIRGLMEARATVQTALGNPTEFLDRDATLAQEPELTPAILGALWCPNDGVGDHTFATRQFAREAAKAGADIRTGARAVAIEHRDGAATAVRLADGERITVGGQLILVANAGTRDLLRPVLSAEELTPVFNLMPQMMYVTNPEGRQVNHLLGHLHRRLAIKQLPDGTVMLSGGVSVGYDTDGKWDGSLSSTAINLNDAIQTMPFIDRSSFVKVDASRVETVAVDHIPIIDRPTGLANTIYGYAWSGHGFAIALGFTKYMVDWALSGEKPSELEPFSVKRFVEPAKSTGMAIGALRRAFEAA
jgi:sarcosine oxidase subunit beta